MCGKPPLPLDEKLTSPGWAFAYAINSGTVFTGSVLVTNSTKAEDATSVTGAKSLATSYVRSFTSAGVMLKLPIVPMKTV